MPNGERSYGKYGDFGGVPEAIGALGDYIPNLQAMRDEVGGSSYVIAEVDGGQNNIGNGVSRVSIAMTACT